MRPTKRLENLAYVTERRLLWLRSVAQFGCDRRNIRGDRDRAICHVILDAQNTWSNFVRSFLLSLLLRPKTISGSIAFLNNLAVSSPGDLLFAAKKAAFGPFAAPPMSRRDEPAWHDIAVFLRTCQ